MWKEKKLKLWEEEKSNGDKTLISTLTLTIKLKETLIAIIKKKTEYQLTQNSNCFNTQKNKLWQNSETQIVTKLKN